MRRIALGMLVFVVSPLVAQSPTYHITHTYALGGDGGWDYIVPERRSAASSSGAQVG
jgi:hypothetical protein